MAKETRRIVPFEAIVNALLDESKTFPPVFLHRFSDLNPKDLAEVQRAWPKVNPVRRQALLEDLEELAESDNLVSFNDLARFALDDPEPGVRTAAIRLLWEDQDLKLAPTYLKMLEQDEDINVRAAAASALGLFIYLGELEEIPPEPLHEVEESLLRAATGPEPAIVRRRALEALGYSSRDEVPGLIENAYGSGDLDWVSSALFAIGRSADPRWEEQVQRSLHHSDVRVQLEAVRAAGQLELASTRQPLLDLLDDDVDTDEDVRAAAIWSLSQIGGGSVAERLNMLLEETDDEDEQEFIEMALENLSFTEDFEIMDMFDFDENGDPILPGLPGEDEDENEDKDKA